MGELLARVEASGYKAVALTVDVQMYSRRERDVFNRFVPAQGHGDRAQSARPPCRTSSRG